MEPFTIDPERQWENSVKLLPQFDTYRIAYKYVNSQPIHAFIVVPKQLPNGPRPLLVRFHGGGWTEGTAESSLRPFFLELALKHGAVIITPDYRLRPEHDMADGIDDVRSFWKWIEQDVQRILQNSPLAINLDVRNLLIGGESAGGYHTAQTALLGMTTLPIKVLFVQYPGIDLDSILQAPDKLGDKVEQNALFDEAVPFSVVEEHLASVAPGTVCARAKFGTRMHLMRSLVQAGKFCDFSGDRAWISPMNSLDTAPKLPPILLYHSKEDEALPWQQTDAWAKKLQALQPDVPLHLAYAETGDHVFDKNYSMAEPWLQEPLEFVQKYWPARDG